MDICALTWGGLAPQADFLPSMGGMLRKCLKLEEKERGRDGGAALAVDNRRGLKGFDEGCLSKNVWKLKFAENAEIRGKGFRKFETNAAQRHSLRAFAY